MFQYFAHNNNLCIGLSFFFFLTTHSNRFCLDHWTNVKAILKICPSSCLLASFWQQSHIYCIWKNKGTALAECDIETRCNQKEKPTQIRHPLLHLQSWILSQSQMDTEFFFFFFFAENVIAQFYMQRRVAKSSCMQFSIGPYTYSIYHHFTNYRTKIGNKKNCNML